MLCNHHYHQSSELPYFLFFKLYFIGYAITVVSTFPPLPPSTQPPTPSGNPYTTVYVHGSYIYVLWLLYSLYCTLHPHDYSVTTDFYFLIPSCFLSSPLITFPSGNHQNILCIYDSVFVWLICLFCFFRYYC